MANKSTIQYYNGPIPHASIGPVRFARVFSTGPIQFYGISVRYQFGTGPIQGRYNVDSNGPVLARYSLYGIGPVPILYRADTGPIQ